MKTKLWKQLIRWGLSQVLKGRDEEAAILAEAVDVMLNTVEFYTTKVYTTAHRERDVEDWNELYDKMVKQIEKRRVVDS